jgi:hypothetical protein
MSLHGKSATADLNSLQTSLNAPVSIVLKKARNAGTTTTEKILASPSEYESPGKKNGMSEQGYKYYPYP